MTDNRNPDKTAGLLGMQVMQYLLALASSLEVLQDSTVQKALRAVAMDPGNPPKAFRAERLILRRGVKRKLEGPQETEKKELIIPVGTKDNGGLWGLTLRSITQHVLIVGATGSGKSSILLIICAGILTLAAKLGLDVCLLAWDFKRDLRRLSRKYDNVVVIPWKDLRFNVLENPPGVALADWLHILADFLTEALDLKVSSKQLLVRLLSRLYEQYKPETTQNYPCLLDLNDLISSEIKFSDAPAGEKAKLNTLYNKTDALCRRLPEVVGCSRGFPIVLLLQTNLVIELDGASDDIQRYLVNGIRCMAFYAYLATDRSDGRLKNVLVIDECSQVLSLNAKMGPLMSKLIIRMSRSTGLGHILADQRLNLDPTVCANIGTNFVKRLSFPPDIRNAKATLGLDEQAGEQIPMLKLREAFVRSESEPHPFLLNILELPEDFQHPVSNDELKTLSRSANEVFGKHVMPRAKAPVEAAGEVIVPTETSPALAPVVESTRYKNQSTPLHSENPLKLLAAFVAFVEKTPGLCLSEVIAQFHVSARVCYRLKAAALGMKLITEARRLTGGRGKPKLFLSVTERGHKFAEVGGEDEG